MSISLFDNGPAPPCPSPFNMAQYVLSPARTQPEYPALEILSLTDREVWTYQQLENAVLCATGGLLKLGLPAGSPILLRLGNSVEFPILFLTAIAAGFLPVPSSDSLTTPEITAIVDDLQPSLIVNGLGTSEFKLAGQNHLHADGIQALFRSDPAQYSQGDPNRPAYIIYTSGTSGKPRGVIHAHRAVWARRMMWQDWYDLKPTDKLMHAGAFNWTYTLGTGLMDPWAMGATAQIPAAGTPSDKLIALMHRHKTTIFAAAPGIYRQILKVSEPVNMPDLRHGLSAGEKLSDTARRGWIAKTNTPVYEALGMSEVSTYISASPNHPVAESQSGYPQQGRRIAILRPDGQISKTNTTGNLAVSNRDPGLMLGYLNAPIETAAKFSGEWFLTGDMAKMADDGAVTYMGRDDDMMNAGGYRVSPIEVEAVLNSHPDIIEAAAAMVEIKANAFVIAAFYQSSVELPESDLKAWCDSRLARYKCPRVFVRLASLPKGANNKIKRAELRAQPRGCP